MRRPRADLHLLRRGAFLREPFLLLALFFLIAVFVVAHKADDGRHGIFRYLDQIKAFVRFRKEQCFLAFQNAEIVPFLIDDAELRRGYLIVDSRLVYGSGIRIVRNRNDSFIIRGRKDLSKFYDTIKAMDTGVQKQSEPGALGYERLGRKTFFLFVSERIQAAAAFLGIALLLFVLHGMPFVKKAPIVGDIGGYTLIAAWGALGFCVITFLFALLVSWLLYANYTFLLGDDALKIKRGIFMRKEVAIPYRQIQDVDIEQDFSYRMLGVSRLVILTAGHEDEKGASDEAEGVLPAIDSALAERLQAELLKRANVQTVVEEQKTPA